MPTPIERLRGRVLWTLAICAALVAVAAPAAAATADLPAAIRQSLSDSGEVLVSGMAADIDADGDLDFVATDGSLDLLVFVNDGTGRYTRKQPAPAREEHTQAPPPGVESREPFTNVYTSVAPPVVGADLLVSSFSPSPSFALALKAGDPAIEGAISPRRPRGPPDVTSLI